MTHDQIREMVRRVNPIPDPSTLEIVDVPVLTTPLERRTEMQTDDRPTEVQADRNRRRGPLVGIAAAAVILIAGLVFLLTKDDTPLAEPAPNATLLTKEMEFQPIDPGAYFVDTDGDPATTAGGTFVIDTSWTGLQTGAFKPMGVGDGALMIAEIDQVGSPACGTAATTQPAGTTAEDLASQFAAAGFTIREAVSPVSAFGQTGYHLVVDVPAECTGGEHGVWEGPTFGRYFHEPEGAVVEYWFLDVEGTPVMIEATTNPESSGEDVAELLTVLDTLVITP